MAKNIFSMFQGYVPKPKRNVFDLSFNNNFTTKFGQLTPVLCKEVIPGDSFKIETAAGLRLMPMAFPVQTPMKAYVHYFYVRNRALWKDWQDFITGTKSGLVPPYVDFSLMTSAQKTDFFKVGGLADYLGIPNVMYGDYGRVNNSSVSFEPYTTIHNITKSGDSHPAQINFNLSSFVLSTYSPYVSQSLFISGTSHYPSVTDLNLVGNLRSTFLTSDTSDYSDGITYSSTSYSGDDNCVAPLTLFATFENIRSGLRSLSFSFKYTTNYRGTNVTRVDYEAQPFYIAGYDMNGRCVILNKLLSDSVDVETIPDNSNDCIITQNITIGEELLPEYSSLSRIDVFAYPLFDFHQHTSTESEPYDYYFEYSQPILIASVSDVDDNGNVVVKSTLTYDSEGDGASVIGDGTLSSTPYDSDIHLNALPFRAYEAIYNSYYRNMQNNPYIINGVEEYNKFIPSNEGGADSNIYPLHQRNWEYDFMTSAVPSPQFGIAPLVGITMTGTATFEDENGTTYYAQAEYDDDGTITGWSTHSSNMPAGTLRMLMDSVGTGISINDLRNVNSFQRFLENSLRVGLKYRDQIKGHFGVEVRYDELEMPEFIGGMSLDINVNQVTQTADVQDSSYPLAGFAGQAGAFGSSKHSVTKYCDEHGFIIGILSVVPVPVYSQLLPKFFTKNEQLDYFFPEFGHIGYQPILQKEISPLQTFYAGDDLNNVFGYQRAWYDYIASTDEVHGQFRTTLRDFVMNRTFDETPALNEDFLLVDPEQVNDVFLVTSDGEYGPEADKILGQLYFKITKKSPIPILGIPRLTD